LTKDNVNDVLKRIVFEDPESNNDYGNVSIRIMINNENGTKQNLYLETPWMKAPFGVSSFEVASKKGDKYFKHKLPVSFDNLEQDKAQQAYHDFMEKLDKKIIDQGFKNAGEWLGLSGEPKAVIKAFYSPGVVYAKDKQGKKSDKYPPRVTYKLPTYLDKKTGTAKFLTKMYDDKKEDIENPAKDLVKGSRLKSLVECTGIWVVNKKFGAGWRSIQSKVKFPENRFAYAFTEDSDDEEEEKVL
jgi:hypothetical protein